MGEWLGFINIRLREEHRKVIKDRVKKTKPDELYHWLVSVADDGYKVSITRDEENDAFVVSLTGKSGTPNDGYTMSQRHRDPSVAVSALRYAHEELAQRDAWENASMPIDYDNW